MSISRNESKTSKKSGPTLDKRPLFRILIPFILCVALCFSFTGCSAAKTSLNQAQSSKKQTQQQAQQQVQQQAQQPAQQQQVVQQQQVQNTNPVSCDYILNKNTKKFHYPSCRSVKQMSEKNKLFFNGSRDEVISMGYVPCGNCHP